MQKGKALVFNCCAFVLVFQFSRTIVCNLKSTYPVSRLLIAMPRFKIGDLSKERKRLKEKVVMENRSLDALHDELSKLTTEKEKKSKELCNMKAKHRRLDLKVGCFNVNACKFNPMICLIALGISACSFIKNSRK